MPKIFLLFFSLLVVLQSFAQRSKGSWQDYLSFTNATKIAISSNKTFCVTDGGLFFYDTQDNSVNRLSGVVDLSDFGIKTIAYSDENEVLLVAYENSNIDLVYETQVINISAIKRKLITGDKSINNITFIGNEAYLSCGFGIVVINLDRNEVKDTYLIGEDGNALAVNDIENYSNFIYAATDEGIRYADINEPNLLDFQNWIKVENIPHFNDKFSHLENHMGKLIANYTPDEYNQDELFILNGNNWDAYLPEIKFAYDIQTNGNFMVVSGRSEVFLVGDDHSVLGKLNYYQLGGERVSPIYPRSANVSVDGFIWIADIENALMKVSGENFESIYPDGPLDNQMFALKSNGSDLWVSAGGRSDSWNNTWQAPRFQNFNNSQWKYFSKTNYPELDDFFDIICVVADPKNPNHIFAGSWGGGVIEFLDDEFVARYDQHNSILESALPEQPNEPFVRIGGLDFDKEGNLWITNSEVAKNLVKLSSDGDWENFSLPEVASSRNIGQVIVTQNNDKWILVPRGHDAYVVDKDGGRVKQLLVTSYFNNGQNEIYNRMNDVYSIAEDNEGAIWIGTSKGVAVYNSPTRIWDSNTLYATQPSLDLNDGIYHPLLETETVTAIAVDGANRKWLGTKNSGVYLISDNGENEVLHFNEENSPLLSNQITSISINEINGEVFFGTDQGLISYMGDAIAGKDLYENVYVYPNPVRETYDGPITVTGLIENTDIKITDISGNLVYKTTSFGGQAIWDGKNLNGNRVKTGVYLVFCNDEFGEETHITKLLFIN